MNTYNPAFQIDSIIYDTLDTRVAIIGRVKQNHLSFETQIDVDYSALNAIICQLQKSNPSVEISSMFQEEKIASNYTQHSLNATQLTHQDIILPISQADFNYKQIRA